MRGAGMLTVGLAAAAIAGNASAAAPLPMQQRVLLPADMHIFPFSYEKQKAARTVTAWAVLSKMSPVALRSDGFVSGLREDLHSYRTDSMGLSTVAEFKTAGGALRAAARALANVKSAPMFGVFAVPGIPGAHGYTFYRGSDESKQYFVSFVDGNFEYMVAFARPYQSSVPHLQTLIAAATSLYKRVAGRPA